MVSLVLIAIDTWGAAPAPAQAKRAAFNLRRDRFGRGSSPAMAGLPPARCCRSSGPALGCSRPAGCSRCVGLWLYEDAYVRAGPELPLS